MKPLLLLCACGLVAGCTSNNPDPAVRYGTTVQVIRYDGGHYAPTKTLQVFDTAEEVKQPYHKIAKVTRPGHREAEGKIVNALIWRARQAGAEGLILLPPKHGWPDYQFSATAIVFDPTNTP